MSAKPFALSIKVVIRDDVGRCLLLKRSIHSNGNPGKWEFPGGKAELGEKFDEALLREVAEETDLTISLQGVAGSAEFEMPTRRIAYLILEARLQAGEVRLSSEHDDYAWIAPQELLSKDLAEQFLPFAQTYSQTHT